MRPCVIELCMNSYNERSDLGNFRPARICNDIESKSLRPDFYTLVDEDEQRKIIQI